MLTSVPGTVSSATVSDAPRPPRQGRCPPNGEVRRRGDVREKLHQLAHGLRLVDPGLVEHVWVFVRTGLSPAHVHGREPRVLHHPLQLVAQPRASRPAHDAVKVVPESSADLGERPIATSNPPQSSITPSREPPRAESPARGCQRSWRARCSARWTHPGRASPAETAAPAGSSAEERNDAVSSLGTTVPSARATTATQPQAPGGHRVGPSPESWPSASSNSPPPARRACVCAPRRRPSPDGPPHSPPTRRRWRSSGTQSRC